MAYHTGERSKSVGRKSHIDHYVGRTSILVKNPDHAHFIHDNLSPFEQRWVNIALNYIVAFQDLRKQLFAIDRDLPASSPDMIQFARLAYPVAYGYYRFEGHMQRLRLNNQVNLNLTPAYINGTLDENQEYLRLLLYYMQGEAPVELPLSDLFDLWLQNQLGHAILLRNILDPTETELTQQTVAFIQIFQAHIVRNEAIKGFLRFGPGSRRFRD